MIDFSKLGGGQTYDTALPPREIFQALPKISQQKYQYPRDVQSQVWQKWFDIRNTENLVIKMNTGGGKTIVGLLTLKSCLNEKIAPAVYVVPDNYLVEQVINEADEIGIKTTKDETCPSFLSGKSILVINIHKLVNGRSKFGVGDDGIKINIGSIIIDDAHACINTVEDQFTIKINNGSEAYKELMTLFTPSLKKQNFSRYNEIVEGDYSAFLQLPFWTWQDKQEEITEILVKNRKHNDLLFSYPLMKDNLKLCNCVVHSSYIEISPHCIPISVIPSLQEAKRKIFMTATLADDTILSTHFGVDPQFISNTITPDNAGDAGDRMILMPQVINPEITDNDIKSLCKQISLNKNVVIIVPSEYRSKHWDDVVDLKLNANNIEAGIERLNREHVGLTVLINRYDGIDLPHNACRLLVLDGIPNTRRLIDKVKQGYLLSSGLHAARYIQTIEQGMGRGVRSNNDYCVVLLTGKELTSMLYVDNAKKHFSPATLKQVEMSESISEQIQGKPISELLSVMDYCFNQQTDWITFTRGNLSSLQYEKTESTNPLTLSILSAYNATNRGNISSAIDVLDTAVKCCKEKKSEGYMKQILSEYVNIQDKIESQKILHAANSLNARLLKPIDGMQYQRINEITHEQAICCSNYLTSTFIIANKAIIGVDGILDNLRFIPDSYQKFEFSINTLANILGFRGQRPEEDYGKGPDNLWALGNNQYLVIECKNEATSDKITKYYCNQLSGSTLWFNEQYDSNHNYTPIIVHPSVIFEYAASPAQDVRIMNEQCLNKLRKNVHDFIRSIVTTNQMKDVAAIREKLTAYKLRGIDIVSNYTVSFKR
ncbi:DEAD/DEAH box helicase family protein [Photobacterium carnosum]|uniref:Helicase n=1 Tax=Photobacterium carnosum TaxID=2023717 RepID=A0A2N4UQI1_9GAMM|nr:DEAD/DEAH box helicase family protein [Photobacterium carnosum]PLC57266.1 helicase [Photobacterium carnosum]